jgi:hypothetical protein
MQRRILTMGLPGVALGCDFTLCARSASGLEWIEQRHSASIEVLDVAGDDDQAMYERGRGKACIINMFVALTQRFAPGCGNGPVDRQNPPLESIEDRRDGGVQHRRRLGLRLPQLGDAFGDLAHRQRTDRKIGIIDALEPGGDILVRRSPAEFA